MVSDATTFTISIMDFVNGNKNKDKKQYLKKDN